MSRDDQGMVTLYVAIMATALMVFITGLVVDGGGRITTYMRASSLAGNAARAAAQAADQGELYRSGTVVIDPGEAQQLVDDYLAAADCAGCGRIDDIAGNTITVTVTVTYDPKLLPGGPVELVATETATALRGVETGG